MRALPVLVLMALGLFIPFAAAQVPNPHPDLVHNPATIEAELREIEAINPTFAVLGTFGTSTAGFPLWMMDVQHPDALVERVLYIDANHHGNEQLGMETAMLYLRQLVEYSTTPEGAERLREVRVVVSPAINPDGTGTDRRANSNNVDLNRNYDYNWGLYGTSDSLTAGTYRGPAPFSEPESAANAALMESIRPDIYLSMHTGSHDIVLPWRQDAEFDGPIPDWNMYVAMLNGIEAVSGLGYRDPSGAGESISWAYGRMGTLSLVVEVDTTQNVPFVQDLETLLAEEIAICWYAFDNLESFGGYLVYDGEIRNVGLGPAYNVTAGREVIASVLAPGESIARQNVVVSYERRLQGDLQEPWTVAPSGNFDVATPAGFLLPLALLLALRRRQA